MPSLPHLRHTFTTASRKIRPFRLLLFLLLTSSPFLPLFSFLPVRLECSLLPGEPARMTVTTWSVFCTPFHGNIFFSLYFLHFCRIFFGNGRRRGERG